MKNNIYNTILAQQGKKLALLIDPDKHSAASVKELAHKAQQSKVDLIFVGGSLMISDHLSLIIEEIKSIYLGKVIIFPGNSNQISASADGILFLSLISGRNPDFLIGNQVIAAPILKQTQLEILSTGYLLIDGGKTTTAHYMSQSMPIPHDKPEIAACTAMAGEMLGLKLIYMDAGSGASSPISAKMIQAVKKSIEVPLIIGGGMRNKEQAVAAAKAGADIVVIGNIIEENPTLLNEITKAIHSLNS